MVQRLGLELDGLLQAYVVRRSTNFNGEFSFFEHPAFCLFAVVFKSIGIELDTNSLGLARLEPYFVKSFQFFQGAWLARLNVAQVELCHFSAKHFAGVG